MPSYTLSVEWTASGRFTVDAPNLLAAKRAVKHLTDLDFDASDRIELVDALDIEALVLLGTEPAHPHDLVMMRVDENGDRIPPKES